MYLTKHYRFDTDDGYRAVKLAAALPAQVLLSNVVRELVQAWFMIACHTGNVEVPNNFAGRGDTQTLIRSA